MFYNNFVKACAMRGISPSVAAEEIGFDRSAVTGWKKGSKPKDTTILKIAEYFGISPEDLTGSTGPAQRAVPAVSELDTLPADALDVARAYHQADDRSRAIVRLALGMDDNMAIAARGGRVVKKPSPASAEALDRLSRATQQAADQENDQY